MPTGTTIFQGIKVEDPDIIGDILEVNCINRPQVGKWVLADSESA
jgi:hypothetical protein